MDVRVRLNEIAFTDNCCPKMGAVWPIWEQQDGADRPLRGVRLQATGLWGILIGKLAPTHVIFILKLVIMMNISTESGMAALLSFEGTNAHFKDSSVALRSYTDHHNSSALCKA